MKERNIYRMLTVTLAVAVLVLVVVLIRLYRNVYYIPETAIADLCATLAEDGITLTPSQVSRKRESGVIYMGSDNDEDTAYRLTESEIRNAFAVPDGMLYLQRGSDHVWYRFPDPLSPCGCGGKTGRALFRCRAYRIFRGDRYPVRRVCRNRALVSRKGRRRIVPEKRFAIDRDRGRRYPM